MTLVTFEDQSPTMRRAKIRVVLAMVLLLVAIASLIAMGRKPPAMAEVSAPWPVKAAQPVKAAPAVASKPEAVKPAPVTADVEPAKPPQAPPDPVYTSFTAEPAPAVATAAAAPASQPAPEEAPAKAAAIPPHASKTDKDAARIEASANGRFLLQAGVFAEMENARRQLDKLAQHHIDTHLESKVRIGPFAKPEDADSAKEKVKSAGLNITLDDYQSSKGLLLQALFTDMESAKQLQARLDEIGFASRCETRILVGPFDTKAKADSARNRIKALNISVVLM
jgi:cell division protein FtsN